MSKKGKLLFIRVKPIIAIPNCILFYCPEHTSRMYKSENNLLFAQCMTRFSKTVYCDLTMV